MAISLMRFRKLCILFAAFVSLAILAVGPSSQAAEYGSTYFPRVGEKSFGEEIRELGNPAVMLVISFNPGAEDLPAIAYSRIGTGAKVDVAFVTNGEDIPGDLNGESLYELSARRKEEAYQALSYLGVGSYFLNVPAVFLQGRWNGTGALSAEDSVIGARLDSVIDHVEPDVIVLDRDPLYGNSLSPREELLQKIVLAAVRRNRITGGWRVSRVVKESVGPESGAQVPVGKNDPLWSQNYRAMALNAERFYSSLKFQIPLWNRDRHHRYQMIFPAVRNAPMPLTGGLPAVGNNLRSVLPYIKKVSLLGSRSSFKTRLRIVREAIVRVDSYIGTHERSLGRPGMRVAAHWTNSLEKLRSTILGVDVQYSVSDTVLTRLQLFFLRFGKIQTRFGNAGLKILFPGVLAKKWIVNAEQKQYYSLHEKDTFNVLTPKLKTNSTGFPEGFMAEQMRYFFRFMVIRRSGNPDSDFVFSAAVPLIIAPIRSIQILTPQVAAFRDPFLRVRLKSNSRDSARGILRLGSRLVSAPPAKVDLRGKNYIELDTLHLTWRDTSLSGVRRVELLANTNYPVAAFYVHYLQAKVSKAGKVAFCSSVPDSPLKLALSRLGVEAADLTSSRSLAVELRGVSTFVVDRFSLRNLVGSRGTWAALKKWVVQGGRLVLLPQYGKDSVLNWLGKKMSFRYLPISSQKTSLHFKSGVRLLEYPNVINKSEFGAAPFPLAFGKIVGKNVSVVISASGERTLLAECRIGKGEIILCALNLAPRFLAIDEPSYGLLANLLSH